MFHQTNVKQAVKEECLNKGQPKPTGIHQMLH